LVNKRGKKGGRLLTSLSEKKVDFFSKKVSSHAEGKKRESKRFCMSNESIFFGGARAICRRGGKGDFTTDFEAIL